MAGVTKAYVSLLFICIVWGTTYLAIKIGVNHYPAFLFAGVRQTIAGLVLGFAAIALNRKYDFSLVNLGRQALIGLLMLSFGNGCVTWGEQYIPSGIAALICSMMPIFAVLFNLLFASGERFNAMIVLGMVLGTVGVGLIFRNDLAQLSNHNYLMGILAVLLATASWALGSIINNKNVAPVNPFLNAGMQLFFGGVFMLFASPVLDDLSHVQWFNLEGLSALLYLVVFGSVLAYAAYMYALSKLPVGVATIYAYVNPLVAVFVGYLVLREPLNIYTFLSFLTIIIGVFMVNKGYRKLHRQEQSQIALNAAATFPEEFPLES